MLAVPGFAVTLAPPASASWLSAVFVRTVAAGLGRGRSRVRTGQAAFRAGSCFRNQTAVRTLASSQRLFPRELVAFALTQLPLVPP